MPHPLTYHNLGTNRSKIILVTLPADTNHPIWPLKVANTRIVATSPLALHQLEAQARQTPADKFYQLIPGRLSSSTLTLLRHTPAVEDPAEQEHDNIIVQDYGRGRNRITLIYNRNSLIRDLAPLRPGNASIVALDPAGLAWLIQLIYSLPGSTREAIDATGRALPYPPSAQTIRQLQKTLAAPRRA